MPSNGILPSVRLNRQQRIRKLKLLIKGQKDLSNIKKVLADFMIEEGLSIRKLREYLKVLNFAGEIDETIKI